MIKKIIIALALLFSVYSFSQISISTNTPSAALDITSTSKGLLAPRLTYAQKMAITSPVAGLQIWCSDCGTSGELDFYNGTTWITYSASTASLARPSAPTNVVATPNNLTVAVAFTASASNGGSAITGYTVTSSPGNFSATGTTSPLTVTGLTNGTSYTFTVVATNAIGNSLPSSVSTAVIPANVPGAPTNVFATAAVASAIVAFNAPISNGGSVITGYKATSSPGNLSVTGATSPLTVTGLTNGTSYTFTVVAINAIGNSLPSSVSTASAVIPVNVPGAPTNVVATASNNASASISFTAPASDGFSTITGYTATASPGNIIVTGTTSPLVFSNVNSGTTYTYSVVATNAIGNSVASSVSNVLKIDCGAYIAAGTWKKFMCHNLGADTSLDPNTPVDGIFGNYYQWGIATVVATTSTQTGIISGWNTTSPAVLAWSDSSKTSNDPCPTGYRVPKQTEWNYVADNPSVNYVTRTGSWSTTDNFTTTLSVGSNSGVKNLTLPAAGFRQNNNGALANRGTNGLYWSSTTNQDGLYFYCLTFRDTAILTNSAPGNNGFSVRCISE